MALFNNNSTTVEEINEEVFQSMIPALIFLLLLMPFGIFGNAMVLYIYGLKLKKSNVQLFITALAFFDILGCFIGMPFEMIDLILPVMYPDGTLCRIGRASITYFCNASILMLLLTCIERYQKICHSTKTQLPRTHANMLLFPVGTLALLMAIPIAFVSNVKSLPRPDGDHLYICIYDFDAILTQILFGMLLMCNLTILVIIFVLYCLVWRTASHHFKQSDTRRQLAKGETNNETKLTSSYKKLNRTNKTLVAITVLYTVSFVPSLLLFITYPLYAGIELPLSVKRLKFIIFRMWALNCTMNPLVYGFCNEQFRKWVLEILHLERFQCHNDSETSTVTV